MCIWIERFRSTTTLTKVSEMSSISGIVVCSIVVIGDSNTVCDVCDSYIVDCINADTLLPLKSVYLLGCSPITRKEFSGVCNPLGDRSIHVLIVADFTLSILLL